MLILGLSAFNHDTAAALLPIGYAIDRQTDCQGPVGGDTVLTSSSTEPSPGRRVDSDGVCIEVAREAK